MRTIIARAHYRQRLFHFLHELVRREKMQRNIPGNFAEFREESRRPFAYSFRNQNSFRIKLAKNTFKHLENIGEIRQKSQIYTLHPLG